MVWKHNNSKKRKNFLAKLYINLNENTHKKILKYAYYFKYRFRE
jgi:hypothetical protein